MGIYIFAVLFAVGFIVGGLALIVALQAQAWTESPTAPADATAPKIQPQRGDFSALAEGCIEGSCRHV